MGWCLGSSRMLKLCEFKPAWSGFSRTLLLTQKNLCVLLCLVGRCCGLPGDAEESLAHIFPAQPFLASTFCLYHQPVLETGRIHSSCHRFPIDRIFPRQIARDSALAV